MSQDSVILNKSQNLRKNWNFLLYVHGALLLWFVLFVISLFIPDGGKTASVLAIGNALFLFINVLIGLTQHTDKLAFVDFRTRYVFAVGEAFMPPVARYVFAETLQNSVHFTAGRHECLPYSDFWRFKNRPTNTNFSGSCVKPIITFINIPLVVLSFVLKAKDRFGTGYESPIVVLSILNAIVGILAWIFVILLMQSPKIG